MPVSTSFFPKTIASGDQSISEGGITRRDWFAGQAIVGIMAMHSNPSSKGFATSPPEQMVRDAYAIADLMEAESGKGGQS